MERAFLCPAAPGFGKLLIDASDVFVKQAVEAADPGLADVIAAKCGDEVRRIIVRESLVWPAAQVNVCVGNLIRRYVRICTAELR